MLSAPGPTCAPITVLASTMLSSVTFGIRSRSCCTSISSRSLGRKQEIARSVGRLPARSPEAADELIARARRRPDLEARRRRAESLTDERMGELLEVLSAAERDALVRSLADLGREE